MTMESSPRNSPATPVLASQHWPWGQVGLLLFGISMCLSIDRTSISIVGETVAWIIEKLAWLGSLCLLTSLVCAVLELVARRKARRDGSEILHLPWLRKATIAAWSVFFLSLLISMFVPAIGRAYQAAKQAGSQKLAAGPWNVHPFANDMFQVSAPANWEAMPDPLPAGISIQLSDRENDLLFVASVVPKQDLSAASLDAFRQYVVTQSLQQSFSGLAIEEERQRHVDGYPAIDFKITGTINGANLIFLSRIAEYPNYWMEVRIGTTRSRFSENEAMFEKIMATLHQRR